MPRKMFSEINLVTLPHKLLVRPKFRFQATRRFRAIPDLRAVIHNLSSPPYHTYSPTATSIRSVLIFYLKINSNMMNEDTKHRAPGC